MFDNAGLGGAGFGSVGFDGGFEAAPRRWQVEAPPVPRGQETGAGPDDVDPLRLDLVDGPSVYAIPATGTRPWMRHGSALQRSRFDLAHARLDDPKRYYWRDGGGSGANVKAQRYYPRENITAREQALRTAREQDLDASSSSDAWSRFRQERVRLELGRLYHGVDLHLPFYFAAPGKPRTQAPDPHAWRKLRRDGHFDHGHRSLDLRGDGVTVAHLNTAAASVCGSNNEDCQRKFSQERVQLEYIRRVRARSRPQDFYGFYFDRNGNVGQVSNRLGDADKGQGEAIFIPDPTGQSRGQEPQGADAEEPSAPVTPRFNPNLLRFDPSRLRSTPAAETAPPVPDGLPPEVQAELDQLRAELAAAGVETSSLRDMVELLQAQAVELEGEEPGFFSQLWSRVKAAVLGWFDGDDGSAGPPSAPAAQLPETSGASLPPELTSGEAAQEAPGEETGAGPDDAPQSFGSRLLSGAKDLALWGGVAATVIILTWIITVGVASRWVVPAAASLGGAALDTVGGLGGKALDNTGRAASALVPVLSKGA